MDLNSIVVNISLTVFLIIGLMIFILSNREVDGKTNKYFILYIEVVCMLLVFDILEYYLSQLPIRNNLRYFTTAMCYTLRPVAITIMNILLYPNKQKHKALWVPSIVLAIVAFTNQYTNLICRIYEENYWVGGELRFLPHIVSGICIYFLIAETISNQRKYKSDKNRLFVFIILINVFAAVVETVLYVRFLLTGTMMVSCVLYYSIINKQNEKIRTIKYEKELAQNRISIMMSQIQPHFLFNSLSSISNLCEKNPMEAQKAINDFSDYLRGNLDSLKYSAPIPFSKELKHIQIYLSLEKMRFASELNIVYNINAPDFLIPTLTVQPIVENAVKYGVGKKEGGGTVTIASREDDNFFFVTVSDDGVGYDPTVTRQDGRTHIGIDNVRARLSDMVGGTLTIDSEKGVGTTATIRIPKEKKYEHTCSRR